MVHARLPPSFPGPRWVGKGCDDSPSGNWHAAMGVLVGVVVAVADVMTFAVVGVLVGVVIAVAALRFTMETERQSSASTLCVVMCDHVSSPNRMPSTTTVPCVPRTAFASLGWSKVTLPNVVGVAHMVPAPTASVVVAVVGAWPGVSVIVVVVAIVEA